MPSLAHIINPVQVSPNSDLYAAQPITFESMRIAQELAQSQGYAVEILSTQYPEDRNIIPNYFHCTPNLSRSILDFQQFEHARKLPLLKDILDQAYLNTTADYIIFTNVDIAVLPHFYTFVAYTIQAGYDAFVINRRTINSLYTQTKDLLAMYAQVGHNHPGYDCFIFSRKAYEKYILGEVCVGTPWIGRVLLANLISQAQQFKVFKEVHLTFHLGDDRSWRDSKFGDYEEWNKQQLLRVIKQLKSQVKEPSKFDTLNQLLEGLYIERRSPQSSLKAKIKKFLALKPKSQ